MTIAIDKPESAGFRIKTAENLAKNLTGLLITISGGFFSRDCGLKVRPQSAMCGHLPSERPLMSGVWPSVHMPKQGWSAG